VEMVSGGNGVEIGIGFITLGLGVVAAAGIGGLAVGGAFLGAPLAAGLPGR